MPMEVHPLPTETANNTPPPAALFVENVLYAIIYKNNCIGIYRLGRSCISSPCLLILLLFFQFRGQHVVYTDGFQPLY